MRAERLTVLVVPRRVKVVMISTLQRVSSVHSLWHPPAAACVRVSVTWHQSWSQAPAQVNPCRLLALPVKTSSYIVPVSAAHCHCPSNIKRTPRRLDTCLIQCVSHAAVHWSARSGPSNETIHAARRW